MKITMNVFSLILLSQICCVAIVSGIAIPRPDAHSIRKRSTPADHSITEAKGRHRTVIERQLLLTKLINAIDTSGSSEPETTTAEVQKEEGNVIETPQLKTHRRRHRGKGGKSHKRNKNRASRSLEKSIAAILRSEYRDDVVEAIANVVPSDAKTSDAVQRIRKFAKRLACSCMEE